MTVYQNGERKYKRRVITGAVDGEVVQTLDRFKTEVHKSESITV